MFNIYCAFNELPVSVTDNMSTEEAMTLRNESQARDPVKGIKVKYQLAV